MQLNQVLWYTEVEVLTVKAATFQLRCINQVSGELLRDDLANTFTSIALDKWLS